ncbi:hypothetical protein [Achromobacter insuavis]|uniref:hypothetical protein n=1 Tax=Achromobacter insuavis TaxID=1287735 RepID=UPI0015D38D59|nr:hypothetical protein [Achromobacter insuavis]
MDLKIVDLQPGDVLLCYSCMTAEEETAAETGYSHVAITLREGQVLEATNEGVRVVSVDRLFEDYDHIAVLRELNTNEIWDESRLDSLEKFAAQHKGKRFNQIGLARFPVRKESYRNDQMERVQNYFAGTAPDVLSNRGIYFCSELITAAFIHVGVIQKSAAVVFTPETFSPSDIAKDGVFGFFFGYVKPTSSYVVPDGDFFKSYI